MSEADRLLQIVIVGVRGAAAADEYATRMYFLARMAGSDRESAIRIQERGGPVRGHPSYYDLPPGSALPPGMTRNPEKTWPYDLRLGPGRYGPIKGAK